MPELNYTTHGHPDQPAIMLLHGFMSCNGQWLLNTEALSKHFYLVTVELWGHGDSPCPTDPDCFSAAEYIRQFESIRLQLGIDKWHLIGQSYGAGVVLNYAVAQPEVCDHIVVTNSRSAFGSLIPQRENEGGDQPQPPADLRKLPYHPIHARRFPAHVKSALVEAADGIPPEAISLGGLLGASLNFVSRLQEVPQPVLLTNGVYEKSFQQDLSHLRERYTDLNVVDLEGGHSVNIEAADGFNTAVIKFLNSGN